MAAIGAEELRVLTQYIYSISGVALDSSKAYLVETRLRFMLQKYGCATYMDLYHKARADGSGDMEKEIINAITTNETLFFRDSTPFDMLKFKILPDLIDARSQRRTGPIPIRIWSAACSTGQEVYSIAIALRETLGNLANYQISILGTDISDEAIAKASYGQYNKFEIERGLDSQTLRRYFTAVPDGWKIRDDIRAMAVFKKFNLMKPFLGLGKFDIIFCRNVAIYFTQADKKAVFEKMTTVLEPDGALIIGSTESLTGVTNIFEAKRYMRSVFYQPIADLSSRALKEPSQLPQGRSASLPSRPAPVPRPPVPVTAPMASPKAAPLPVPSKVEPKSPGLDVQSRPKAIPDPGPGADREQTIITQPLAKAPLEKEPVAVEQESVSPETPSPAPASEARRRPPLKRQAPMVGDKSALKRLLMQKKQRAQSK